MPPPGWLHVNGVSLSTDVQQQMYDTKIKHMISSTPPNSIPFTSTINDRQYQKLEDTDLPKKIFIDRQIKKVKSLPGLIKGTALSRHSAPYSNQDESYHAPIIMDHDNNNDDTSPLNQHREQINETRRLRVSFSDFNKVQFFEDNSEYSQQSNHRRHRHRSSKKSNVPTGNNTNTNTNISPPSIQHSQSLYTPYRPLSRQQPVGHELNIKKQQLIPSPRSHASRITHLPDILNQTLPTETSIHEKYVLQREKPIPRFAEPVIEIPINSSAEISRESTRAGGVRPIPIHDYNDQHIKLEVSGDGGMNSLLNSSSMNSSLSNRQRPPLRSISLRQQFVSSIKTKSTNNHQTITNPRRSASLKHTISRVHSIDYDHDDIHTNGLLSTYENRPMTGITSFKQLKRNCIVHFNSKNPSNGNTPIDSYETNRHINKSNFHESSQERFQNVLKIVRPPYVTSISSVHHDQTFHPTTTTTTNHPNGSIRSSHTNSEHHSHEYHNTSNIVYV